MKKITLIFFGFIFILSLSSCSQKKEENYQQKEVLRGDVHSNDYDVSFNKALLNPKIALIALDGSTLAVKSRGDLLGCNDKIVFKNINGSYTIKQLLEKMFSFSEYNKDEGVYNVFQYSDLKVEKLKINDGVMEVELFGKLIVGGMCDNPRVFAQLDKTIHLFYSNFVGEIKILINGEELGDFLSEKD